MVCHYNPTMEEMLCAMPMPRHSTFAHTCARRSTSGMADDHGYRHLLSLAARGGCHGGDPRLGSAPASARPMVREGDCERRVNRGDVLIGATTPCAAMRCSLGAK